MDYFPFFIHAVFSYTWNVSEVLGYMTHGACGQAGHEARPVRVAAARALEAPPGSRRAAPRLLRPPSKESSAARVPIAVSLDKHLHLKRVERKAIAVAAGRAQAGRASSLFSPAIRLFFAC